MSTDKVQISIANVKQDLANGISRKEIGEKYGLNFTNTKALFQHPELKGLKVKKPFEPAFEIVDSANVTEPTNETPATATQAQTEEVLEEATAATEEVTTQKGVW